MLEAIAEQFMLSQTGRQANSEPINSSLRNLAPITVIPESTLRPSFRNRAQRDIRNPPSLRNLTPSTVIPESSAARYPEPNMTSSPPICHKPAPVVHSIEVKPEGNNG